MDLGKQLIYFVLVAEVCAFLPIAESRSVRNVKRHLIKKRSLYEETCPPPYVIEVTEKCKDSCLDDDYCIGNQMCCFDGCSYVCMDPVPSEPVIDWIDDKEGSTPGPEELTGNIEVVTPVIEELGCFYHGMMLNDGERIPLGCKVCSCFNGNLMCDVSNCNKEYQARLALELSGSGSGDDEDGDDKENLREASGNGEVYPITGGLRHKEDFTPLEKLRGKNTNGVEMKEEFVPFGKEHGSEEDSGGGESGSGSGDHFVPYDEEKNNGKSGDNVASFARRRL